MAAALPIKPIFAVFSRKCGVSEITDVEESGRGRGLFSMRERIGFLGGTSGIESEKDKGTTVWARIPLHVDIMYDKNKSSDS